MVLLYNQRIRIMNKSTTLFVAGDSVHAPRQSYSKYVQTFRRYIYKTRQPEHPYSTIRQYKRRLQGPSPRPSCMESCPDTTLLYATSTSTSTFPRVSAAVAISASTAPLRQDPSYCRISYLAISTSSASAVPCYQPFLPGFH